MLTKDLGKIHNILGTRITRSENGSFYLDQEALIESTVKKFNLSTKMRSKVPLPVNEAIMQNEDIANQSDISKFQSMIGSLLYLSRYSRPDISLAVNRLSQFSNNPSPQHIHLAEGILKYINSTKSMKLCLGSGNEKELHLTVYCDADWAADRSDRKSTSGYAVYLNDILISWGSKKQKSIALSTMEAEYIAISEGLKEAIWVKQFLGELGFEKVGITIKCDNQSAITICRNPTHHNRAKHIDIRYHFIRELVEKKEVIVEYVSSERNVADIFTKALGKRKFHNHCQTLGLICKANSGGVELYSEEEK